MRKPPPAGGGRKENNIMKDYIANVSIAEASRLLGWPPQFLRAAIEFEKVPFGVCIKGKHRRFQIRRNELEAYIQGELTTRGQRGGS